MTQEDGLKLMLLFLSSKLRFLPDGTWYWNLNLTFIISCPKNFSQNFTPSAELNNSPLHSTRRTCATQHLLQFSLVPRRSRLGQT